MPLKKPAHGKANTDPSAPYKSGHSGSAVDALNNFLPPPIIVPPNPKLLDKLSFIQCTTTANEIEFPRYLQECGILDMITHAFTRLEREKQRPADPWDWLRYRFFLRTFNPGDREAFCKTLLELTPKRDKLVKERSDLLRAKVKREEVATALKV